jgi:Zn finger protein HypA/HybF involved in hydrogenase expression
MRKCELKEKKCLNCGKDIPNRNIFCNNKCQGEYNRKKDFEEIENGNETFYYERYKLYLIHKNGEKCMKCGWKERHPITGNVPIQLEHIDGNSDNNKLNNLLLLCPNCHSLTPTYGALNKGNGREKRRLKRNENKVWESPLKV